MLRSKNDWSLDEPVLQVNTLHKKKRFGTKSSVHISSAPTKFLNDVYDMDTIDSMSNVKPTHDAKAKMRKQGRILTDSTNIPRGKENMSSVKRSQVRTLSKDEVVESNTYPLQRVEKKKESIAIKPPHLQEQKANLASLPKASTSSVSSAKTKLRVHSESGSDSETRQIVNLYSDDETNTWDGRDESEVENANVDEDYGDDEEIDRRFSSKKSKIAVKNVSRSAESIAMERLTKNELSKKKVQDSFKAKKRAQELKRESLMRKEQERAEQLAEMERLATEWERKRQREDEHERIEAIRKRKSDAVLPIKLGKRSTAAHPSISDGEQPADLHPFPAAKPPAGMAFVPLKVLKMKHQLPSETHRAKRRDSEDSVLS